MNAELKEFGKNAEAWFADNTPAHPGFMLPLTFMEVGTDQQFEFLRDWQRKVYEAGYLGAAWPKEYGGGGLSLIKTWQQPPCVSTMLRLCLTRLA